LVTDGQKEKRMDKHNQYMQRSLFKQPYLRNIPQSLSRTSIPYFQNVILLKQYVSLLTSLKVGKSRELETSECQPRQKFPACCVVSITVFTRAQQRTDESNPIHILFQDPFLISF